MPDNGLFSLAGEVAVVIGGGGVLAGAMAEGLAQAGARVAVAGRTWEPAGARAKIIEKAGGEAIAIQCDATSKTDLQKALAAVIQRFGRVDTLINAAGVNSATPFFEIGEDDETFGSIATSTAESERCEIRFAFYHIAQQPMSPHCCEPR